MKIFGYDIGGWFPEIDEQSGPLTELIPILLPLALILVMRFLLRTVRMSGTIGVIILVIVMIVYWMFNRMQPARIWVPSGSWFNFALAYSFLLCVERMATSRSKDMSLLTFLIEGICALGVMAYMFYKKDNKYADAAISGITCGISCIFSWTIGNRYHFGVYAMKKIAFTWKFMIYAPFILLFALALLRTCMVMKDHFYVNQ